MKYLIGVVAWVYVVVFLMIGACNGQTFVVQSRGDTAFEKQLANRAEQCWKEQSKLWFGSVRPIPDTCVIRYEILPQPRGGVAGITNYDRHTVGRPRMQLSGPADYIIRNTVPHEVQHLVMAAHLGPIPRWLDEGLASLTESNEELDKIQRVHQQVLQTNRGIPCNILFSLKEYPADAAAFYSQSVMWTRFLMHQKGIAGVRQLASMLQQGSNNTTAFNRVYGWQSLQAAQNDWNKWVADGAPANRYRSAQYGYVDPYGRVCPPGGSCGVSQSNVVVQQQPQYQPQPQSPVYVQPDASSSSSGCDCEPIPGPEGPQGPPGQMGMTGMDGAPGAPGKDGENGRDGIDGKDAVVDYDRVSNTAAELALEKMDPAELAARILPHLPPITFGQENAQTGQMIKETPVYLGEGYKFRRVNYPGDER